MVFDFLNNKFQIGFKNRLFATNILVGVLQERLRKEKIAINKNLNLLVLGIPRGGVLVADIVSSKIEKCKFDIIISRKLAAPHNQELAIGAIMEDGISYLNEEVVKDLEIKQEYIEKEKEKQIKEIERRKSLYDSSLDNVFKDNIDVIILVDDGAATGATLIAACRWIRKQIPKTKLIIGLPVAPKSTFELLKKECDYVEVVSIPSPKFKTISQYYQDFSPIDDEQVIEICKRRNLSYS